MLVKELVINKLLVSINNLNDIEVYKKEGISSFLFPLLDFSIGYENSYSVDEINNVNDSLIDKIVLINRILDNKSIDELKNIINKLDVETFVIEDIGLINILKNMNKKIILFINHFNCNSFSVNEWLSYVDSVFLSNELTKKELINISNKAKSKVCIHVFGYNQVMYSRRYLLKNYCDNYNLLYKNFTLIKDKCGLVNFIMKEDKFGTVCFSEKIMDGREITNLNNVLYYYLNTSYIDVKTVLDFINNKDIPNTDNGFLDKETIFKLEAKK